MKKARGFWILIAGLLCLTACRGESAKRLWLKAPDWSRAQAVGSMGIPDPAPFVLDEAENIYFLFIEGEIEAFQARLVALNSSGEPLWDHTFDEIIRLADDPQLLWDGERLHAFWISSEELVTARLDQDGTVLQEPHVISGDIRVDSYSTAAGNGGKVAVWMASDRRRPGLYQVDLNADSEPALIDEEGVLPSLRFSKNEPQTLHALWAHHPLDNPRTQFLYAAYPGGDYIPGLESVVFETTIPSTADMTGPTLGLDSINVYIFWLEIFRTGLEAGFTQTRYVTFPYTDPGEISTPQEVFIPAEHDLNYEPFPTGVVQVGSRYPLAARPSPGLSVLQDISTNSVEEEELVIAFRASVNHFWRRSANQVGLVYMRDGRPTSYQLLSFTQQPSTDPTILSDSNGNLFVTWLETGDTSRFDVYFSSTNAAIKEAFNPITVNDVTSLSAAMIFGLLTGVLLAPVAAVLWIVLPLVVTGLTSVFRRGEQTMRSPGTIITFILAITVFQVVKVASLPDILNYVPFSAWLPLPDIMKVPLQILVPLAIMVGAGFTAWHFTYRRKMPSPLYFMILYVATDALLTMAVYGVLFYGAF